MRRPEARLFCLFTLLSFGAGCAVASDESLDSADESFVGPKADGFCADEGSLEGHGVLALVNDPTTTLDELDRSTDSNGAGLNRLAAENIVAERPFDSLAELDAVRYVGNYACEQLRTHACDVRGLCEEEIERELLVGIFEDVFIGEIDPFVVGDVCVLYVREVGLGPVGSGPLHGIVEDVFECGSASVASGAIGLGAVFTRDGLAPVRPGEYLDELNGYREASYHTFEGAETEFALDSCDPTWADLITDCAYTSASSVGGIAEGFQHCTSEPGLTDFYETVCDPSWSEARPTACEGSVESFIRVEGLVCKAALATAFQ